MKKHTYVDYLDDLAELKIRQSKPVLSTGADKVIEWLPTAFAAVAAIRGAKNKPAFGRNVAMGVLTLGLQKGLVHLVKQTTHHTRPNPFDKHNSFPSGHTATAFMGAALLQHQLPEEDKEWAIAGYAVAVGTGVLRLYQNRHWLSDVALGAVISTLSVVASKKIIAAATKKKDAKAKRAAAVE